MTESRLWVLDRQVFQAIMMTTGIRRQEETMKFLRRLHSCLYIRKPKRLVSPIINTFLGVLLINTFVGA